MAPRFSSHSDSPIMKHTQKEHSHFDLRIIRRMNRSLSAGYFPDDEEPKL